MSTGRPRWTGSCGLSSLEAQASRGWGDGRRLTGEKAFIPGSVISNLRSKLYTADLESGLHYLLRVELASHRTLAGAELKTLKDFVTIVAKVCGVCSGLGARFMTLRSEADLSWMCTLLASGAQPAFGTGAWLMQMPGLKGH